MPGAASPFRPAIRATQVRYRLILVHINVRIVSQKQRKGQREALRHRDAMLTTR